MHSIKTTQQVLTRQAPKEPECEALYFRTKHGTIMVLETEVILRFQGAFSTQMYFNWIVTSSHTHPLSRFHRACH